MHFHSAGRLNQRGHLNWFLITVSHFRERAQQMLPLALAFASAALAPDFAPSTLSCVDMGLHQHYCPRRAYPPYNRGMTPARGDLRVRLGELVPRHRREDNDKVGLTFEYKVACERHNVRRQCVKGAVTIHVHPSTEWDTRISWWQIFLEVLVVIVLFSVFGPAIFLFLCCIDTVPDNKRFSSLSND